MCIFYLVEKENERKAYNFDTDAAEHVVPRLSAQRRTQGFPWWLLSEQDQEGRGNHGSFGGGRPRAAAGRSCNGVNNVVASLPRALALANVVAGGPRD